MMMPLKRYAQFSRRASRSGLWLFQLFILSVVMWLIFVWPALPRPSH